MFVLQNRVHNPCFRHMSNMFVLDGRLYLLFQYAVRVVETVQFQIVETYNTTCLPSFLRSNESDIVPVNIIARGRFLFVSRGTTLLMYKLKFRAGQLYDWQRHERELAWDDECRKHGLILHRATEYGAMFVTLSQTWLTQQRSFYHLCRITFSVFAVEAVSSSKLNCISMPEAQPPFQLARIDDTRGILMCYAPLVVPNCNSTVHVVSLVSGEILSRLAFRDSIDVDRVLVANSVMIAVRNHISSRIAITATIDGTSLYNVRESVYLSTILWTALDNGCCVCYRLLPGMVLGSIEECAESLVVFSVS